MVITGQDLVELAEIAFPGQKVHIGPSSVDVRLGEEILAGDVGAWVDLDDDGKPVYRAFAKYQYSPGDTVTFYPGRLYIAHSMEYVEMPEDVAAFLTMRSTAGRRGLDHAHAGWLEPGWEGQITFELVPVVRTQFRVGDRVAQVIFFRTTDKSRYDGAYQGQVGATIAQGARF